MQRFSKSSRDYFGNFTAYSGTTATSGTAFTSTVTGKALWSGLPSTLTATATQAVTAGATGSEIHIDRGAFYNYNTTTNKFTGAAESKVAVYNARINSLSDSATAKNNSASVTSVKFDVQGSAIRRLFNTSSEAGKLWMWTNVTGSARLTDSSYSASATPTALSLNGRWTATGTQISKHGLANSITNPIPAITFRIWGPGTVSSIIDSGSVTRTTQSIS